MGIRPLPRPRACAEPYVRVSYDPYSMKVRVNTAFEEFSISSAWLHRDRGLETLAEKINNGNITYEEGAKILSIIGDASNFLQWERPAPKPTLPEKLNPIFEEPFVPRIRFGPRMRFMRRAIAIIIGQMIEDLRYIYENYHPAGTSGTGPG